MTEIAAVYTRRGAPHRAPDMTLSVLDRLVWRQAGGRKSLDLAGTQDGVYRAVRIYLDTVDLRLLREALDDLENVA
jgi:hypothetical protein